MLPKLVNWQTFTYLSFSININIKYQSVMKLYFLATVTISSWEISEISNLLSFRHASRYFHIYNTKKFKKNEIHVHVLLLKKYIYSNHTSIFLTVCSGIASCILSLYIIISTKTVATVQAHYNLYQDMFLQTGFGTRQ